ncbi:restriction endonuclease subunit S [Bacillus sp. T3]|uniref:restriction endonuclease subunit S n=1 Tax=Bacillus sp. T3 TaxID=467262 RepID=UPI00298110CA|nr:restriction endonuclease subunit S [Bacillus sp. T3]
MNTAKPSFKKLKEVTESIQYGYTTSASHDSSEPYRLLRITDIQDNLVNWGKVPYAEGVSSKEEVGKFFLKNNDIVFARTGATTGKSYLIEDVPFPAIFASYLIRVRPIQNLVTSSYLYFYFQTPMYWAQVEKSKKGAAQAGVNATILGELRVPILPINEQNNIVLVLSKVQKLIEKRKAQIGTLDQLTQSVFFEMFGDVVKNPKKWDVVKLNDLYEIIDGDRGKNYPKQSDFFEEGYCLFLNTGNVTKKGFSFNKKAFISKDKDEALRKGKLQRNDLVITTRGTVGNVAFYDENIPYNNVRINSGMVILRGKRKINPIYFTHYFRNPLVYKPLISGTAQPQMPISNFKNAKVYLPPFEIQNQFAEIVIQIESEKQKMEISLKLLEETFNTLMQRSFKGELFTQEKLPNS